LQTVAVGVPEWLYRLQFELNLPFLLTSAIDLLHKASASGSRKVLFASRDGRNRQINMLCRVGHRHPLVRFAC
jgi:hypothetical protein